MTVLKGNHHVVIWKFLEYTSGDYPVNQYFTNSDSTWWTTHNQVVPLGHNGHEWGKKNRICQFLIDSKDLDIYGSVMTNYTIFQK